MRLIYFIFLCLLLSCGAFKTTSYFNGLKGRAASFNFERADWVPIDPNHADKAYKNKNNQSLLLLNSYCERYQRANLKSLADDLFLEIEMENHTQKEVILKFPKGSKKINAIETLAKGKLEGKSVHLKTLTFRHKTCLYDLILLSLSKVTFDKDLEAFNEFKDTLFSNLHKIRVGI